MKSLNVESRFSNEKGSYTVKLPVLSFKEDNANIIYCPALDLCGSGNTESQAKESFAIVVAEYMNYTTHKGSTELAANLFRATQTEEKLKRDNIRSKEQANKTHYEVGKKVRQTIKELGGTMPENLPVANSIKKLEKAKQPKQLKKKKDK